MTSIQIETEIEQRFTKIAKQTGQSEDKLIRFALLEYLEDQEDIAIAEDRIKKPRHLYSSEDVKRELGL